MCMNLTLLPEGILGVSAGRWAWASRYSLKGLFTKKFKFHKKSLYWVTYLFKSIFSCGKNVGIYCEIYIFMSTVPCTRRRFSSLNFVATLPQFWFATANFLPSFLAMLVIVLLTGIPENRHDSGNFLLFGKIIGRLVTLSIMSTVL